jgi:hypothetical protein
LGVFFEGVLADETIYAKGHDKIDESAEAHEEDFAFVVRYYLEEERRVLLGEL